MREREIIPSAVPERGREKEEREGGRERKIESEID